MDRRERPLPNGEMKLRVPEAWQEFHEVLCEVDSVKGSAKALTVARAGPQSGHPKTSPTGGVIPKGKGTKADNPDGKDTKKDKTPLKVCQAFKNDVEMQKSLKTFGNHSR